MALPLWQDVSMKDESTIHKAEGLGKPDEHGPARFGSIPQLEDEQLVLDGMMQCLRSMKHSERPGVVRFAREWERIVNYRIQITMQERKRRAKGRVLRLQLAAGAMPTSFPSGVRIRVSVSPNRD